MARGAVICTGSGYQNAPRNRSHPPGKVRKDLAQSAGRKVQTLCLCSQQLHGGSESRTSGCARVCMRDGRHVFSSRALRGCRKTRKNH